MNYTKLRSVSKIAFLSVILGLSVLVLSHPATRASVTDIVAKFQNLETLRDYIAGYGVLAPLVSALLMVLQSVIDAAGQRS